MSKRKMKKNEFFVPELIKRTIPAHTKDFQTCERIVYDSEEEAKLVLYHIANYKKVMIWKSRTTKYLKDYLANNISEQPFPDEYIAFFMNYLFGLRLRSEYPDDYAKRENPIKHFSESLHYTHFINKHLKNYDTVDQHVTPDETVLSQNDMSVFFCLFLDLSDCFEDADCKLTETQRSKIEAIISQTDLSLRESFERFVGIFFPKN